MDMEGGTAGAGAVDVAAASGGGGAGDAAAAAFAAAAPTPTPVAVAAPTPAKNGVDQGRHGTGKAAGGTGGQWGDEGESDSKTAKAKVDTQGEKRRRTSITLTTLSGKAVTTIKGGADSWDLVEQKALEHHRGTREWVFIEVGRFCDLGAGEFWWGGRRVRVGRESRHSQHPPRADVVARGEGEKVKTLFWLMGGGGTGKSVTIAVVCKR